MSLEELEEEGLLRPRDEWGQEDPHSHVSRSGLILSWIIGIIACAMMYLGGGEAITWIGLGVFFVFLVLFTYLSNHAIDIRAEKEKEEAFDEIS